MLRISALLYVASLVATASGCVQQHNIALRISAPAAVSSRVTRWTVRVYELGCPTLGQVLVDDDQPSGPIYDRSGAAGTLPAVGSLPSARYFVAALGRDGACEPVGFGCVEARLDEDSTVVVPISATDGMGGSTGPICPPGLACVDGGCAVPAGPACTPCAEAGGTTGCMCGDICVATGVTCEACGVGCDPMGECTPARLAVDPANCGACRHACPNNLGCSTGLCRPEPQPTVVLLDVAPSPGADISRGAIIVIWPSADTTTGPEEVVTLFTVDGPGVVEVRLEQVLPPDSVIARLADNPSGFVTGRVTLAVDEDGDRVISPSELAVTPVLGASDLAVGHALSDIGRGAVPDYPEGMLAGTAFYRERSGSGAASRVPASTGDTFTLMVCPADGSTGGPPPDCLLSL